jgi:hypothetical protein
MSFSYIYFIKPIGMDGPIKIGCSDRPASRLASLMCWSPFPLELLATIPGSLDLERNIHECFLDAHDRGEWFNPSPALVAAVAKLAAGVPVAKAIDLNDRKGTRKREYHPLSPEAERRRSYAARLSRASSRLFSDDFYYLEPEDVSRIMNRWRASTTDGETGRPTPAQFARLDTVLADPRTHFVAHPRRERASA